MIGFVYPQLLWLLAFLPLIALWRGRRGPLASVEYPNVDIARRPRAKRAAVRGAG